MDPKMSLDKVKLREVLERGEVALGPAISSFSPIMVEIAGYCNFDFIRIDNEHAIYSKELLERMVLSAEFTGITPIVRVDKDDPYIIRKVLELGAQGVIVPHVNTKREALAAVKAAKFPPVGERGIGSSHAGKWGAVNRSDFIKWSNEETLVLVMIEDYRAIENLDEIMSVGGIDGALFGPSDFSISLGIDRSNPKVLEALGKTIAAAERHGKYVMKGMGYPYVEQAKKYIDMGVRIIEFSHDTKLLQTMWKKIGAEIRNIKY